MSDVASADAIATALVWRVMPYVVAAFAFAVCWFGWSAVRQFLSHSVQKIKTEITDVMRPADVSPELITSRQRVNETNGLMQQALMSAIANQSAVQSANLTLSYADGKSYELKFSIAELPTSKGGA